MPLTTFEDYTTHPNAPKWAQQIVERLRQRSKLNGAPMPSSELESVFRLSGPSIRAAIHYLRVQGCPVASSSEGYWWATTAGELTSTIAHGSQRVRSIAEWVRGLEKAQQRMLDEETPIVMTQGELEL